MSSSISAAMWVLTLQSKEVQKFTILFILRPSMQPLNSPHHGMGGSMSPGPSMYSSMGNMSGGAMTQCMGAFPGSVTPRSQPCHQFPNFVWFPISKEHISCSQFSVLNLKAKVSKSWMLQGLSEWGSRKPSKSVCLRQQELQQKKLHTCQTPLQVGDSPHSHPLSSPCAKRLKGVSEKVPFSVGVCAVCADPFLFCYFIRFKVGA